MTPAERPSSAASHEQFISVVVPVHDEKKNIVACLRGLEEAMADQPHEILLCYDHDGDNTPCAVEEMDARPRTVRLVKNDLGKGVAHALRAGFRSARGDVVVTTTANGSDDPAVIPAMAGTIRRDGCAVVSGSRYMKGGSAKGGPLLERSLSRLAGMLLRWLGGLGTSDATTNFRAYSQGFLRETPVESRHGFEVGLELTVKAHHAGKRVGDVATIRRDRSPGRSRARLARRIPWYLRWFFRGLFGEDLCGFTGGASLTFFLLTAIAIWCSNIQIPNDVSIEGLDPSWQRVLQHAYSEGLQWGKEIVFSYGPFGWMISHTFNVDLFRSQVLIDMIVNGLVAIWLARAAFGLGGPIRTVLFLVGSLCLLSPEGFLLAGALLVGRNHCLKDRLPPWRVAVGLAFLAFVTWTKLSLFFFAGGVIAVAAAVAGLRERSPRPVAVIIGAFSAFALLFWLLAGQSPLNLPAYFSTAWETTSGYAEAMPLNLNPEVWIYMSLGILLIWLLAIFLEIPGPAPRLPRMGAAAIAGGYAYLAWKTGFVRMDQHTFKFFGAAAFIPLLHLRPQPGGNGLTVLRRLAGAGAVAWSCFMLSSGEGVMGGSVGTLLVDLNNRIVAKGRAVLDLGGVRQNLQAHQADRATKHSLPLVKAAVGDRTIDMVDGLAQGIILLDGLRYRPRPVFQSYAAYTPRLLEMNAAHFTGADAPDFVLTRMASIDGRYPGMEDCLAIRAIVARYDPVLVEEGWLLLERGADAPGAVPGDSPALLERSVTWGEEIDLTPYANRRLAVAFDIRYSGIGRVLKAVHRAPIIYLETIGPRGTRRDRIVPGMVRMGFLLQPSLVDVPSLLAWYQPGRAVPDGLRIDSLRILLDSESTRIRFEPEIGIRMWEVRDGDIRTLRNEVAGMVAMSGILGARLLDATSVVPGRQIFFDGSIWALDAHAPARHALTIPVGAEEVEVGFGIRKGAYTDAGSTDGVWFRVYRRAAKVGMLDRSIEEVLWERYLAPLAHPEDRGLQRAVISLAPRQERSGAHTAGETGAAATAEVDSAHAPEQELILETTPGPAGNAAWDWSFWADVRFDR